MTTTTSRFITTLQKSHRSTCFHIHDYNRRYSNYTNHKTHTQPTLSTHNLNPPEDQPTTTTPTSTPNPPSTGKRRTPHHQNPDMPPRSGSPHNIEATKKWSRLNSKPHCHDYITASPRPLSNNHYYNTEALTNSQLLERYSSASLASSLR